MNQGISITRSRQMGVKNMELMDGQTIIFFGDSITRANRGSNYITILDAMFRERLGIGDLQLVNAGRDGDMIDDLLSRVQSDVLNRNPDWVIVLIGINDVFFESILMAKLSMDTPARKASSHQHIVHRFKTSYSKLLNILKSKDHNLVICTTTAVEGITSTSITEKLVLINDTIRDLSYDMDCGLVDIGTAFNGETVRLRQNGLYDEFLLTVDGVHLNDQGAYIVAQAMFDYFSKKT